MTSDSRTAQVAALCAYALGEAPASVQPIAGQGLVNAAFDVQTRRGRFVFRVQFDSDHDGEFRKEAWCMERAREAGVPGPEVVAIARHAGHTFAVHTWMPGVVGTLYRGDLSAVWCEMGRQARLFHQVRALGFGEHLGGAVGAAPDTSLAGWAYAWEEFIFNPPLLVDRRILTAPAFEAARKCVAGIGLWAGEPYLCHGDLALRNVLVDADGNVCLLDWGTATGHLAPQRDLAEVHAWSLDPDPPEVHDFSAGYGLAAREVAEQREALHALQLWRMLSSARWLLGDVRRQESGVLDFVRAKLSALLAER
jgi:aminoglycoside phosphotransferase (APT) family kinase protein